MLSGLLAFFAAGTLSATVLTGETFDPTAPEFQAKVEACEAQLGASASHEQMVRCLGLEERYHACKPLADGAEPLAYLSCMGFESPFTMPLEDLREGIESRHPNDMLIFAQRLFEQEAEREAGLFWFYASQLRWRTRLSCHDFPPGDEGALYGAMFATLGPIFNEWAGENIDVWLATLDDVHAWDIASKARFAEDAACLVEAEEQRAGMLKLKQSIIDKRAQLEAKAAERRQNRAAGDPD